MSRKSKSSRARKSVVSMPETKVAPVVVEAKPVVEKPVFKCEKCGFETTARIAMVSHKRSCDRKVNVTGAASLTDLKALIHEATLNIIAAAHGAEQKAAEDAGLYKEISDIQAEIQGLTDALGMLKGVNPDYQDKRLISATERAIAEATSRLAVEMANPAYGRGKRAIVLVEQKAAREKAQALAADKNKAAVNAAREAADVFDGLMRGTLLVPSKKEQFKNLGGEPYMFSAWVQANTALKHIEPAQRSIDDVLAQVDLIMDDIARFVDFGAKKVRLFKVNDENKVVPSDEYDVVIPVEEAHARARLENALTAVYRKLPQVGLDLAKAVRQCGFGPAGKTDLAIPMRGRKRRLGTLVEETPDTAMAAAFAAAAVKKAGGDPKAEQKTARKGNK